MSQAGARPSPPSFEVDDLLGGERVLAATPRSTLDWVAVIRLGIPSSAVDALTKLTHLTRAALASAVGIPEPAADVGAGPALARSLLTIPARRSRRTWRSSDWLH